MRKQKLTQTKPQPKRKTNDNTNDNQQAKYNKLESLFRILSLRLCILSFKLTLLSILQYNGLATCLIIHDGVEPETFKKHHYQHSHRPVSRPYLGNPHQAFFLCIAHRHYLLQSLTSSSVLFVQLFMHVLCLVSSYCISLSFCNFGQHYLYFVFSMIKIITEIIIVCLIFAINPYSLPLCLSVGFETNVVFVWYFFPYLLRSCQYHQLAIPNKSTITLIARSTSLSIPLKK